jgi:hypothetical protein
VLGIEQFARDQSGYPRLLTAAVMLCSGVYIFFGVIGYAFYHDLTCPIVFMNLRPGTLVSRLVKGSMAANIVCSYPLALFPALQNLEALVLGGGAAGGGGGGGARGMFVGPKRAFLRCSVVVFTSVAAYLVPDFGFLTALCGAYFLTIVAFVLPPLFYIHVRKDQLRGAKLWANWALVVSAAVYAHWSAYTLVDGHIRGT